MTQSKKPDNTKPVDTSERMPFQDVDNVFCALHDAFNVDSGEAVDQKFLALWWGFLAMVGWTEEEYFEALDKVEEGNCPDCGKPLGEHDETEEETVSNVIPLPTTKKNDLN